ncbi:hypothetical protein [Akkermansia muciniphila]|nr:hypothetical protein [Akkermansia muciniphila]MBT8777802.1 hypothetical protein [Akkermansia muciniphila]
MNQPLVPKQRGHEKYTGAEHAARPEKPPMKKRRRSGERRRPNTLTS